MSTVPLPIGIWLPTITFSVIPFNSSISPNFAALAIVGTVISKAALARTLSLFLQFHDDQFAEGSPYGTLDQTLT